ncbi:hypothetical protein BK133_18765 [Paenibacillus sp. FSL H8-0548]|uniref:PTS sugar transporter subunit IIB n=1 Tax=Paenibacillus sp. FSL H8-0548 TaxID=1920422 RepID=UPI00096E65AB|nr:PTS sugar transporter subunit IIB [Paenibacillus sp. FSL H8-0548]OMF28062.1 hypothetical protein BK133_18765 [Paenibacillus sp. FSL H8-0548]
MRQIIVACNSGLGTSLMIRINIEAILVELNVNVSIVHTDLSSLNSYQPQLIVCSSFIKDSIEDVGDVEIIGLDDIMNRQYVKQELMKSVVFQQWLSETE